MEMNPRHRLLWIGMSLYFTLWKIQARSPGECNPPPHSEPTAQSTDEPLRGRLTTDQIEETPTSTLLERLGKTRARAPPDGHCMYSALAAQSGGEMADWQAARRMVAEWIRAHWPLIATDMQARGLTMESLLDQVEYFGINAPPHNYGDEATLYIAAWILHQRVIVINTLNDTTTVVLPDATPPHPESQEVVVLFNGTDHYDGTTTTRTPRSRHGDEPCRPPRKKQIRTQEQRQSDPTRQRCGDAPTSDGGREVEPLDEGGGSMTVPGRGKPPCTPP